MATFNYYQKIGIYPRNRTAPRIIPAITEISRAVGAPGVAMSTYQAKGVGLHRTGEACDFQAGNARKYGNRFRDALTIHNEIAKYVLANWERLNIRYMAWNGKEWGGSWGGPERERRQAQNYGGSDPWHQHHVHIDFKPGAIPGAKPGITVGIAHKAPTTTSKNYYSTDHKIDGTPGPATFTAVQRFLSDRGYYKRAIDGEAGTYTWTAFQEFLKDMGNFGPKPSGKQDMTTARAVQQWLTRSGHFKDKIVAKPSWTKNTWRALQQYMRYAHKDTKTYPLTATPTPKPPTKKDEFLMALTNKQQTTLVSDMIKTKKAVGRSEIRERAMVDLLTIIAEAVTDPESRLRSDVNKTKKAVGRLEKAYQEAVAAEAEDNTDE